MSRAAPTEEGTKEAGGDPESNPVEEEDVRRADEFTSDMEKFSANGSGWKAYAGKRMARVRSLGGAFLW